MTAALLATVRRGSIDEAQVRGHAVILDAGLSIRTALGDADAVTPMRSCVKPIQALPFLRHAADALGAGDEELAIACASHNGEPVHVDVVERLLKRVGLDETALLCGAHAPYDAVSAQALIRVGAVPRAVHNNCSGKHAAMLATCVVRGWPLHDYRDRRHPLQREIAEAFAEATGEAMSSAPLGIDGCGLPTYGLPLRALAAGFLRMRPDPAFARALAAMRTHPHLVGGRGRFDTLLMGDAAGLLVAKGGGAAIWVGMRMPDGPALALKLEAGSAEHLAAVAMGLMEVSGLLEGVTQGAELAALARPRLRNWAGTEVGDVLLQSR